MTAARAIAAGFTLALVAAVPVAAHQAREASPAPSSTARPAAAPDDAAEPAAGASLATDPGLPEPEQGAFAVIPWRTALTGKLHNKIVHFPLAFGLAAGVLLIVAPRWPAYEPAARLLLIAAAVAAVAAYFSGGAQEDQFDDSPFHAVVELHEKFGITSAITLAVGVVLTRFAAARRFLPVYGVVLLLVLTCTGFLGGVLSHS